VAAVSHTPHLIAAALIRSAPATQFHLAAGGLRDTTRVALGDSELWRQIVLQNRANILDSLTRFEGELHALRSAVAAADADQLRQLLTEAQAKRGQLDSLRGGEAAE
jgi:prephenate dehydrogenase